AINRIYQKFGLNDLEQLEDAPEYQPGLVLTPELIQQYITGKVKQAA
ncbi:MAG: cupin protein, partial [Massilia sp.]|nr:cupin protein [Massilia sp.]